MGEKLFQAGTEAEIGSWRPQRQAGADGLTGTDDIDIASHILPCVLIRDVGAFLKCVFPCSPLISISNGTARKKTEIELTTWDRSADQNSGVNTLGSVPKVYYAI